MSNKPYSGHLEAELEDRVMDALRVAGGINFKIGDIPVHIGQEVLNALQLTLQDLPLEKRFEVLQAFSNVLENIKLGSIHSW
jgi:hypothetical protein